MVDSSFDHVTASGLNLVGDNLTKITSNYSSAFYRWASDPWEVTEGLLILSGRGSTKGQFDATLDGRGKGYPI